MNKRLIKRSILLPEFTIKDKKLISTPTAKKLPLEFLSTANTKNRCNFFFNPVRTSRNARQAEDFHGPRESSVSFAETSRGQRRVFALLVNKPRRVRLKKTKPAVGREVRQINIPQAVLKENIPSNDIAPTDP